MGIYDRDYMGDKRGSGLASWSMVVWLLIANGLAFVVQHAILDNQRGTGVILSLEEVASGKVWRFVTYQFCHASPAHFLGNMLLIFFVGRMVERLIGARHLLYLYLAGGLAGGIAFVAWEMLTESSTLIGASASALGILIALVALIPEERISLLFLPFEFKVKYVGWFVLGINVLGLVLFSSVSETSFVAHLGGMGGGWAFVRYLLPVLRRREMGLAGSGEARRRSKIAEAERKRRGAEKDKEVYLNKKVDAILEKINEHGMHSLTDEERRTLERSSEKLARKLGDK